MKFSLGSILNPHVIELERILDEEMRVFGAEALIRAVQTAIEEHVRELGLTSTEFFRQHDQAARGHYQRGIQPRKGHVDVKEIAALIRHLRLPLQFEERLLPWVRVQPGSTVAVVLGIRHVSIEAVSTKIQQRAVGARDAETFASLVNFIQTDLKLQCKLELELIPADSSVKDAEKKLIGFTRRKDISAIVVVGSPIVNPLADPIAKAILNRPLRNDSSSQNSSVLPAKFRWSTSFPSSFLSEPQACRLNDQGLRRPGDKQTTYPRDPDDSIHAAFANGIQEFDDCGLLLMSCDSHQVLVLAAGHGGAGTEACLEMLQAREEIDDRLQTAHMLSGRPVLAEVVLAKKKLNGPKADVDDLSLSHFEFAN